MPSFSPDCRSLVFAAQRDGRWKLYRYVFRGLREDEVPLPQPLLPGPSEERNPAYGPRGVAFLSNLTGTWDLWFLEGDDLSRLRRIFTGVDPASPVAWVGRWILVVRGGRPGLVPLGGKFFRPLSGPEGWWRAPGAPFLPVLEGSFHATQFPQPLSPDFALVRCSGFDCYGDLLLCTLEGQAWTIADGVRSDSVAWSPDGTRIAYIRRVPGSGVPRAKEAGYCPEYCELWLAWADGTEPRLVHGFPTTVGLWCPAEVGWSPDGGRIYFGVAGSPTHREIWSVSPAGDDLTYHAWGWDLAFYPDGRISGITRGWIPFVYDPKTGEKLLLEDWGMITQAFFSPDGERFLAEVGGVLTLVSWQEGTERPLLPLSQVQVPSRGSSADSLQISWDPSGKGFAFASRWDGQSDIWYYDLEFDTVRKLTDTMWDEERPVYSPDGRYLAYVSYREGVGRVHILSLATGEEMATPWEPPAWGPVVIWRPKEGR